MTLAQRLRRWRGMLLPWCRRRGCWEASIVMSSGRRLSLCERHFMQAVDDDLKRRHA